MFCAKCGKEIDNDSTFCPFCGQKVDASVEKKKDVQPPSSTGGIKTVGLIWGTVIGLVALVGVVFGVGKLIGGSSTKEITETIASSVETQDSALMEPQEDMSVKMESSITSSEEDSMYAIDPATLCNRELKDFFQLHLGCYVNYYLENCDVEPVNISTMLKHTGVVGAIDLNEGMRVISDYSDDVFSLNIGDYGQVMSAVYNKNTVDYRCLVSLKESNIIDTFRYYKGTDAQIGIVAKIDYFIDEESVDFKNKYAVVSLRNSASNPEEWLIAGAVLISESDYKQVEGKSFDSFLVSEDMDASGLQSVEWKQTYVKKVQTSGLDAATAYCLRDINGDNIPEMFVNLPLGKNGTHMLFYISKDGSLNELYDASMYSADMVECNYYSDGGEDKLYQYDSSSGMYNLILAGEYTIDEWSGESSNYIIDGVEYSESDYYNEFTSLTGDMNYFYDENVQYPEDKLLVDAILEY